MRSYLAVDIGASSGRHILGRLEGEKLVLEEIYRFPNGAAPRNGTLCWDYPALFGHILEGLRRCGEAGRDPCSMGVDTWGVDFILLDGKDRLLGQPAAYRDDRTAGMGEAVSALVPDPVLYARTGIQKQPFNTIYQLMACRELLDEAASMLMVPDYFHFLLTGVKSQEYTNASTTGLLNAAARDWDWDTLRALGYPLRLFVPLSRPGRDLGPLLPEWAQQTGCSCRVVLPPTHDTAAAVLGAPLRDEGTVFLSSGTWSLLGVERNAPVTTEESRLANFTNEGGCGGTYRYLKNIMGLWMIQSVKKELGDRFSFADLAALAERDRAFPSAADPEDRRFLAPDSMTQELKNACRETGQPVPETPGQLAQTVFSSLAGGYARAVKELSALTGRVYTNLVLVGGGSQNRYLNSLTAQKTGLTVFAGPAEGTALGNLVSQMLAAGELRDISHARHVIANSFDIEEVHP